MGGTSSVEQKPKSYDAEKYKPVRSQKNGKHKSINKRLQNNNTLSKYNIMNLHMCTYSKCMLYSSPKTSIVWQTLLISTFQMSFNQAGNGLFHLYCTFLQA